MHARFAWSCLALLITATAVAQESSKKLLPPKADQIKQAETAVNDLFKKELAHPNKDFAQQLLKLAQDSKDDPSGKYVLLRKAIEIGSGVADTETVFAALGALESSFDVDTTPILIDALASLSKRVDVSDRTCAAIDKAYARNDYDSAAALANVLLASAHTAKDASAIKTATAKVKEVASAREQFKKTIPARKTLEANPTDPEANRIVGSFLCFVNKDWQKGVPMLALREELTAALAKTAKLDLEGKNPVAIGDMWEATKGGKDRALYWYQKALPELSGIQKLRVEKILKEAEESNATESGWMAIFRSSDPSIWNKNVNEGPDKFAVPLDTIPESMKFVRIRIDSKKAVVMAATKSQLATRLDGEKYGWNGTNRFGWNAYQLGVFYKGTGQKLAKGEIQTLALGGAGYSGWGFGVRGYIDDKQGYVWAGKELSPTVFEISVRSSALPRADQAVLLK